MAEPVGKNWNPETVQISHDTLSGLSVVITGKLQSMERTDAELLVERAGGNATGSISSKTDLLIAGDKAGSKLKKASDLGVEIINEAEFIKRLGLILP